LFPYRFFRLPALEPHGFPELNVLREAVAMKRALESEHSPQPITTGQTPPGYALIATGIALAIAVCLIGIAPKLGALTGAITTLAH
jgi:hypothetical protein